MKFTFPALLFMAPFFLTGTAFAEPLLSWETAGLRGDEPTLEASPTTHVEAAHLSRGPGVKGLHPKANTFTTRYWSNQKSPPTEEEFAYTEDKFIYFSVQASDGYQLNLHSLNFQMSGNLSADQSYQWTYSIDGEPQVPIGSPFHKASKGVDPILTDLSQIAALQSVSKPVEFRLYAWGFTGRTNDVNIGPSDGSDLVLEGTVSPRK